jgi:hypothetical protein
LYDEKRDDEPVEQLGDGAVLRTVSHEIPWGPEHYQRHDNDPGDACVIP